MSDVLRKIVVCSCFFVSLLLISHPCLSTENVVLVSPAVKGEFAVVNSCRPAFSWSAIDWAEGYDLIVFVCDQEEALPCEEMAVFNEPILEAAIPAQALSWSPDSDNCLSPGNSYVWYVRAVDSEGFGPWSQGSIFIVDMQETAAIVSDTLERELSLYLSGDAGPESPFAGFASMVRRVTGSDLESLGNVRSSSSIELAEEILGQTTSRSLDQSQSEGLAVAGGDLSPSMRGEAPDTIINMIGPVRVDVENSGTAPGDAGGLYPDPGCKSFNYSYVDVGEVLYSNSGIRFKDYGKSCISTITGYYYGGSAYLYFEPDSIAGVGYLPRTNYGGTLRMFTTGNNEDAEDVGERGISVTEQGNVGIGETSPVAALHVVDNGSYALYVKGNDNDGSTATIKIYSPDNNQVMLLDGNEIDAMNPADGTGNDLYLNNNSQEMVIVPTLKVTGGSDFSEQFDIKMSDLLPEPGMVVSIDPVNTGKLLVSDTAYDRKVAGIISGAGGVNTGMIMGQEGSVADGAHPVALTGRVYCWVDADCGAVVAGDLLTSSSTPGHAMKVVDHDKAQGAIIGKAMSSLEQGKGLVLVLVSLQ
ncbi:hypothetical protein KAI46_07050 [bacterium]|nr:hypothetical protein [bacterium]